MVEQGFCKARVLSSNLSVGFIGSDTISKTTGGLYNPETGKKVFKIIALLKYGFVNPHKETI